MTTNRKNIFLWSLIFLPYLIVFFVYMHFSRKEEKIKNSSFIIIDKDSLTLTQIQFDGTVIQKSAVATGKGFGNKSAKGDYKTPQGVFRITTIEDASGWSHDFKDDTLGEIKGAYGPYFIRLSVPGQKGIGIHGTHDSLSIGTRASEGCIRMKNNELKMLVENISTSSLVVILPSLKDVIADNQTAKSPSKKDSVSQNEKKVIKKENTLVKKEKAKSQKTTNDLKKEKKRVDKKKSSKASTNKKQNSKGKKS